MSEKQSKFPSEVIDLPSKGQLYSKEHPLASGTIEIKYMTAREEDILSSNNLIQKGIVLDKLVESVIITQGVSIGDLLIGDKNAIVLATRIMGFGSDYDVTITCPNCMVNQKIIIDLSEVTAKEIDFNFDNRNNFEFDLPKSKTKITYKHLTHADERKIEDDIAAYEKIRGGKSDINKRKSTQYRYIITSIDGDANPSHIRDYVENQFMTQDSRALIAEIEKNNPDMETKFDFVCSDCDHSDRLEVPIDISFLWPTI